MQTSMACKPWRFLVQLPSDPRRFPPASLRETRETPVHFHAKPRHFPRKPPQFPLRAHAVPPLPSVDSHRNAPRTRACASSHSATGPTFSAHQRNARDNKPMQLSTTAIPAHEKGAREPLTLYYLVFVFTVCSILGLYSSLAQSEDGFPSEEALEFQKWNARRTLGDMCALQGMEQGVVLDRLLAALSMEGPVAGGRSPKSERATQRG